MFTMHRTLTYQCRIYILSILTIVSVLQTFLTGVLSIKRFQIVQLALSYLLFIYVRNALTLHTDINVYTNLNSKLLNIPIFNTAFITIHYLPLFHLCFVCINVLNTRAPRVYRSDVDMTYDNMKRLRSHVIDWRPLLNMLHLS